MSVLSINTNHSTPTLESVKSDFFNWRNQENRSRIIPDLLWDKVFLLLATHKKGLVLRILGISNTQLATQLKHREHQPNIKISSSFNTDIAEQPIKNDQASFVKAIITTPIQPVNYFDVVLTKCNGATMQINKLSYDDILKLTQIFAG